MSIPQTYIVTGGNRGIGFDLCRRLASAGHNVILCSRSIQAGREACDRINTLQESSGSCQASQLDVSNPSSVQGFIKDIGSTKDKQIFALINNAGIYGDDWTQSVFDSAVSTNFNGPINLAIGLAPHLKPGGRIVNVTSSLGQLRNLHNSYQDAVRNASSLDQLRSIKFKAGNSPAPFKPTYSLTKAMINRATQILAEMPEFQHLSINSADPGWVRTDMGGMSAPGSVTQGSGSILAALELPADVTGGNFYEGRPQSL